MLNRREFSFSLTSLLYPFSGCGTASEKPAPKQFIYMMNHVHLDDFSLMSQWGINTVLVTLNPNGSDWQKTYDAALKHHVRLVPMIWGQDQSIWQWNQTRQEWELNDHRYPGAIGAKFLRFLKNNVRYQQQTFAIYSFHEPLAQLDRTGPKRLQKFYQQITQEEFRGTEMRVYGEDMTFVWPQADECLTGVLDYEVHTFYPFADTRLGQYRPFSAKGFYMEPTSNLKMVLAHQTETIAVQLKRIREAKPAANGRRPELIVILQAFVDSEQKDLWNRMPDAEEMKSCSQFLLDEFQDQIAGIAWYPFRQAASNYKQWLHKDRYDSQRRDRWQVVADVARQITRNNEMK